MIENSYASILITCHLPFETASIDYIDTCEDMHERIIIHKINASVITLIDKYLQMSTNALVIMTVTYTPHARTPKEATRVTAIQDTPETDRHVPVSDVHV